MPTTTIRIEDELKTRIAAAAERSGVSPHAFILEAIAQTLERAELEEDFHRVADERWAKLLSSRKAVAWADAKSYLQAQAQAQARGARVRKPAARTLDR